MCASNFEETMLRLFLCSRLILLKVKFPCVRQLFKKWNIFSSSTSQTRCWSLGEAFKRDYNRPWRGRFYYIVFFHSNSLLSQICFEKVFVSLANNFSNNWTSVWPNKLEQPYEMQEENNEVASCVLVPGAMLLIMTDLQEMATDAIAAWMS